VVSKSYTGASSPGRRREIFPIRKRISRGGKYFGTQKLWELGVKQTQCAKQISMHTVRGGKLCKEPPSKGLGQKVGWDKPITELVGGGGGGGVKKNGDEESRLTITRKLQGLKGKIRETGQLREIWCRKKTT